MLEQCRFIMRNKLEELIRTKPWGIRGEIVLGEHFSDTFKPSVHGNETVTPFGASSVRCTAIRLKSCTEKGVERQRSWLRELVVRIYFA